MCWCKPASRPTTRRSADRTPAISGAAGYQRRRKYYFGVPVQIMQGKPKEVFTQIFNNAFPAGSISVEDAVKQMNAAFGK